MAREWRRLLVSVERFGAGGGGLVLRAEESHYLRRVLRLRPGDQLALVDGAGRLWTARLQPGDAAGGDAAVVLEQPLAAPLQRQPPPHPQLVLAVAWPRLDADVLLRMACELGIDRFTPLQAGRSVAAAGLKPERQAAILREAVEQCERLWQPQLDPEQPALDWLGRAGRQGEGELRLLATTRRPGLPSLDGLLEEQRGQAPPPARLVVAIGPEGGWTAEEEQRAEAAGWRPVSLGETILRSSTAAVLAAGVMVAWRRRLGLSC